MTVASDRKMLPSVEECCVQTTLFSPGICIYLSIWLQFNVFAVVWRCLQTRGGLGAKTYRGSESLLPSLKFHSQTTTEDTEQLAKGWFPFFFFFYYCLPHTEMNQNQSEAILINYTCRTAIWSLLTLVGGSIFRWLQSCVWGRTGQSKLCLA